MRKRENLIEQETEGNRFPKYIFGASKDLDWSCVKEKCQFCDTLLGGDWATFIGSDICCIGCYEEASKHLETRRLANAKLMNRLVF